MISLMELDGMVWKIDDVTGRTWVFDTDDTGSCWKEIKGEKDA